MAFAPLLVFAIVIAAVYTLYTWRVRRADGTGKPAPKWDSPKNLSRTAIVMVLVGLGSLVVVSATSHEFSLDVIVLDAPMLIFTGASLVWVYVMRRSRGS